MSIEVVKQELPEVDEKPSAGRYVSPLQSTSTPGYLLNFMIANLEIFWKKFLIDASIRTDFGLLKKDGRYLLLCSLRAIFWHFCFKFGVVSSTYLPALIFISSC